MTTRDPHLDPHVGDLLRPRDGGQDRLVTAVYRTHEISYRSLGPKKGMNVCSLEAWQRWCRYVGARVVEQEAAEVGTSRDGSDPKVEGGRT